MNHIINAHKNISSIIRKTPLELNTRLSEKYNCNLFIKREDLQLCRSFKIRGALNKIKTTKSKNGIVCASAGNHAQGVAYSTQYLGIKSDIFVPNTTPLQKINRIKYFSDVNSNIHIVGNCLKESLEQAKQFSIENEKDFCHPFDDINVIYGQGTIGLEIYQEINPDIIICGVGGGGLVSGVQLYSKDINKSCKIIGVEPNTCSSMKLSLERGKILDIDPTNNFVDGATVSRIGEKSFEISNKYLDDMYDVSVGNICGKLIELYEEDGIISEPAGVLPFTILDNLDLTGKNVVCVLSGGNNDLTRYPDIIDKYQQYIGIRHYYIIKFIQRPGQLKSFVNNILDKHDNIIRFEYIKKTDKDSGNVLVGIDLSNKRSIIQLEKNLKDSNIEFIKIEEDDLIYNYLV